MSISIDLREYNKDHACLVVFFFVLSLHLVQRRMFLKVVGVTCDTFIISERKLKHKCFQHGIDH